PTKQEVRFSNENELLNLVTHAISYALHDSDMIVEVKEERREETPKTTLPFENNFKDVFSEDLFDEEFIEKEKGFSENILEEDNSYPEDFFEEDFEKPSYFKRE